MLRSREAKRSKRRPSRDSKPAVSFVAFRAISTSSGHLESDASHSTADLIDCGCCVSLHHPAGRQRGCSSAACLVVRAAAHYPYASSGQDRRFQLVTAAMKSTAEADRLSSSTTAPNSVPPVRPTHSQLTSFALHRPPPLATITSSSPPADLSASSAAPSASSTSSSPDPLVLSPSDLSSIITLKQNHDTLTTQHAALLSTLAQRDTQLARLHSKHRADEAEWERRTADGREQYERVMRDWSEESEKRHRIEESARQWRQQLDDAMDEQRRQERTTRLLEADLTNERRMSELLREKVQQLDEQLTQLTASPNNTAQSAADEIVDEDASLLSVHKAVLSRRVQRLELELTAANEQLAHQQVINKQQLATLTEINTNLAALNQLPAPAATDRPNARNGNGDATLMAEVECVVLKERLKCERRDGWRRERKLYCFVLLWLMALLAVSVGGMLCI